jgi:acyl-CoA synthetase (AMP-forming)/AMP-acid ligase II/acyl carrier protein
MSGVQTMVDLLRRNAVVRPKEPAYTFLRDGDRDAVTWSWATLDHKARAVAVALLRVARPGERVLVLYPQGLDYLAALFGCMYAGVLAVPLQPPGKHRAKLALPKLEAIASDGGVAAAATLVGMLGEMEALVAQSPVLAGVAWVATDVLDEGTAADWQPPALKREDLAYLQYTSGSTSTPKGVMVSHANLLYQLSDFHDGYGHDHRSVMVSWLPTFHDLGLVYGVFMPLYVGFHGVLLDPLHFLQRPMRWLEAIHRHRGTHAPAPNFAFDLCASKSTAGERAQLDLSCWRVALNGAEPIRYESEARFVEAFAAAGVTWDTLSHAYGMSEATACISKEWLGTSRVFLDVDGAALEQHRVEPRGGGRRVAGCGRTSNQTVVRAVDPETRAVCGPDQVGELWVGGPTRAEGYWQRPEATEETFFARTSDTNEGPFLRTGDLGFVRDGQVFVTGRLKDMIIVRGENHYPQDIEWSVQECHPAIRPSCVAAFTQVRDGVEAVSIVAEVYVERLGDAAAQEAVFGAVRDAVGEHGLGVHHVVLIQPRTIFKTSSGKIMRRRTREAMEDGSLDVVARWDRPAAEAPVVVTEDVRGQLEAAPEAARASVLAQHILVRAAALLGLPAEALDAETPLKELGFDSVQAVELADQLGQDLGREVSVTSLFEHPSADALAAWLLRVAVAAPAPVARSAAPELALDDDVSDDELAELLRRELEDL